MEEILAPVLEAVAETPLPAPSPELVEAVRQIGDSMVSLQASVEFILLVLIVLCGLVVGCAVGLILAGLLK